MTLAFDDTRRSQDLTIFYEHQHFLYLRISSYIFYSFLILINGIRFCDLIKSEIFDLIKGEILCILFCSCASSIIIFRLDVTFPRTCSRSAIPRSSTLHSSRRAGYPSRGTRVRQLLHDRSNFSVTTAKPAADRHLPREGWFPRLASPPPPPPAPLCPSCSRRIGWFDKRGG